MNKKKIIIATIKSWNIENAGIFKKKYQDKYDIYIFTKKNELSINILNEIKPDYIFFPHWSWLIPKEIHLTYNCIVFHMTDLPYGRGGSPLQNLIYRNQERTKISAIKVVEELDAGNIYIKEDFFIGIGSAEEIFIKISQIIYTKMIPYIIENNPIPIPQKGDVVYFKRRKPDGSNIFLENFNNLNEIYNFIRMLDAENYPNAFIKHQRFRINFYNAKLRSDRIEGSFEIKYE